MHTIDTFPLSNVMQQEKKKDLKMMAVDCLGKCCRFNLKYFNNGFYYCQSKTVNVHFGGTVQTENPISEASEVIFLRFYQISASNQLRVQ